MSNGSKSIISYFDPVTFLDCQSDFEALFGLVSTIYGVRPCNQDVGETITSQIQAYASKCMLDTFLSICKTDYVGVDNKDSAGKMTHEICKQIINIATEVRVGGRPIMLNPDELYGKYISNAAVLPVDTTTWYITLCSSFLIV